MWLKYCIVNNNPPLIFSPSTFFTQENPHIFLPNIHMKYLIEATSLEKSIISHQNIKYKSTVINTPFTKNYTPHSIYCKQYDVASVESKIAT